MSELMPGGKRSFAWSAAGFLLAFCLIFYWKILFTSQAIFPWDAPDQFYPLQTFVHEELRHFRLPLWDPYVMSGYPIVGDVSAQIFYPINWLYVIILPNAPLPYRLMEIHEIFHFFLAGLFMYLLARDFVESELAALLAGLLFMSSGAMVAHTQHTPLIASVAWYPLVFLMARRALLRRKIYLAVCAGGLFGIQILAGHWQSSVYLGLFLFLYFAYQSCCGPERRRLWPFWVIALAIIALVGAALAMVQIVPSYELAGQSVRAYVNYLEVSVGNHPRFLLTLFLPNYLGGLNGFPFRYPADLSYNYVFLTVPGLLLALAGLVETVRRRDFFWLGAVVLFTELSFGAEGYLAQIVYHTPLINVFRTMATFFDLTNFVLCLLAAIGADTLIRGEPSRRWQRAVLVMLLALVLAGIVGALPGITTAQIPGWRHAFLALVIFSGVLAARFRGWFRPTAALAMILAVVGFEFWFYSSNQIFNSSPENPKTFLSADYAVGRKESLQFLRADASGDFRVGALGEYQWFGNGWDLWRIPGITGLNPLALRRYNDFMRIFSHITTVRIPMSGEDHNFGSPLADLLGVKYLVLADPSKATSVGLGPFSRYHPVGDDLGWWRTFRNDDYVRHLLFYPAAYTLPNQEIVNELMSSNWFDFRHTLLLESDGLSDEPQHPWQKAVQSLPVTVLYPGPRSNATPAAQLKLYGGEQMQDPYCAQPVQMIGGWGRLGDRIEFPLPPGILPGRYRLLVRYTANELAMSSPGLERLSQRYPWYRTAVPEMPRVQAAMEGGAGEQTGEAASLPRTLGWPCQEARAADLGEFHLDATGGHLAIRSLADSTIDVYSIMLVEIPDEPGKQRPDFSYQNYSASSNRIEFEAQTGQDGFLLLNEIYYPGWQATVDGQPSEILPADGAFRALYIAAGAHRIAMRFIPPYFYVGVLVSVMTAIVILVCLGVRRRRAH